MLQRWSAARRRRRRWPTSRSPASSLHQTIHMFDLLLLGGGQAPVEVYATGLPMMDPEITAAGDVDTSMLILRSPTALCHIDNSRHTGYGYDERIEVFGSTGLVSGGASRSATWRSTRQGDRGWHVRRLERMEPRASCSRSTPSPPPLEDGETGIDHPMARRPARPDDRRGSVSRR